jgi:hypothetical protein
LYPFDYLGDYTLLAAAIIGIEAFVVAIAAASHSPRAIPVWTAEPGIEGYFLNPTFKSSSEIGRIVVVPFVTPPGKFVLNHCHQFDAKLAEPSEFNEQLDVHKLR